MFGALIIHSHLAVSHKLNSQEKEITMKKLTLSFIMLLVIAVCYITFGTVNNTAVSGTSAAGSIKICWGQTCATDVVTTNVTLHNAAGQVVGSCTITPPQTCCKISGDFPTGTYYFTYHRPTGVSDCRTGTFSYTNGTEVTLNLICYCP